MYRGGRNPLDRCEVCGLHFIRHRVLRCPVDIERKHNAKRCSELPEGGGGCDPSWKCWKRPEWCIRKARAKSAPTQHQETGGRRNFAIQVRKIHSFRIFVTKLKRRPFVVTEAEIFDYSDIVAHSTALRRFVTFEAALKYAESLAPDSQIKPGA
jgi:hypothetical protein